MNREIMKLKTYLIRDSIYEKFKDVCYDNDDIPSRVIRKAIKEYIRDKNK